MVETLQKSYLFLLNYQKNQNVMFFFPTPPVPDTAPSKTYSWFLNRRSSSSMLAISSAKVGLGP